MLTCILQEASLTQISSLSLFLAAGMGYREERAAERREAGSHLPGRLLQLCGATGDAALPQRCCIPGAACLFAPGTGGGRKVARSWAFQQG